MRTAAHGLLPMMRCISMRIEFALVPQVISTGSFWPGAARWGGVVAVNIPTHGDDGTSNDSADQHRGSARGAVKVVFKRIAWRVGRNKRILCQRVANQAQFLQFVTKVKALFFIGQ
jgi:hypothetical protein